MEKQIGKNVSSGAKKVERVEKITQESVDANPPAQEPKTKKKGTVSKSSPKKTVSKRAVKKEEKAAKERVKGAKERAEKKQEKLDKKSELKRIKLEKKAALKEKKLEKKKAIAERKLAKKEMLAKKKAERIGARAARKADLKKRRVERKAERAARRELLKNETKAEREKRLEREKRERIALKAKKQEAKSKAREDKFKARENARSRRAEDKKHRREQKNSRRTPGFGGWLAAVISLGTACLVLATVVTAGAFRMNDMAVEAESGYRSTLYEMVSVCEDLDDSLGKLRLSGGASEQRRLLTDILVDTALLEASVEKLPVDRATSTDISSFINRTGEFARTMLAKLASGTPLDPSEKARVRSLYEINDGLYGELNTLVTSMTADELRAFFTGGGSMAESFSELAKGTRPAEISEAPFAEEGNVGENRLSKLGEISSSEAETLAGEYFAGYRIADIRYTGETVTEDLSAYDFVLTDENGTELFAQIAKRGGKLVFFDTYEECTGKNFDLDECDALAREFLKELGIENVEAVWLSDMGMVASLTYTTVEDGVRIYPETIRVRVCEEKGRVIGMDARGYLLNDKTYDTSHKLTRAEAQEKLDGDLTVYSANLALISAEGREVVAYEFGCTYGEEEYLVYVDANTGEEVEIFRVMASARGSYLR